ncbi:small ribosomal subunit Rsm22 family protein [Frankia sp. Ag45/Mut15]|uniref:Small ribosomal subunit Rsm22 family protein n=1 Tax=Frankia umida TaxID=573489 RepID=A0ABT0K317_9ACTN|nr:small ribosomal subunit Rsm22 family protein [Frankia umida]MCK9878173.1 small ribosomal subunit Rsm22 family protein [Frankia umida]
MTSRTRIGFDADVLLAAATAAATAPTAPTGRGDGARGGAARGTGGGAGGAPRRELARAYRELSERYRGGSDTPEDARLTDGHVRAYLAARLPATLAVSRVVLAELADRRPRWQPHSLLDLGAGPGPATWAALEVFGEITGVDLVERSARMIAAGRGLARLGAPGPLRTGARWHHTTAQVPPVGVAADLTVASYLLGELPAATRGPAVAAWWRATTGALVIIDTGTPDGYARVLAARSALLADGATITAPCPSDGACPLPDGDWCHFARRVERSAVHRALKDAERGHEDEKFAYLIASRGQPAHAPGRLLRAPRAHAGHIRLALCVPEGQREAVVARSRRDAYAWARRARWGDPAPGSVTDPAAPTDPAAGGQAPRTV